MTDETNIDMLDHFAGAIETATKCGNMGLAGPGDAATVRNASAELKSLRRRVAVLAEEQSKARAFADKLKSKPIQDALTAAFFTMQNHGMPYTGPTWEHELKAYDAARSATDEMNKEMERG